MFGFGTIGQFALGQASNPQSGGGNFSSWDSPARKVLAAAVIATTFVGFVAPPAPAKASAFTQFSQPKTLKPLQTAWLRTPAFIPQVFTTFSKFSQPQFQQLNLPDEQPSAFFEIVPPALPTFIGFAQFQDYFQRKPILVTNFTAFNLLPIVPDAHDGGWIKKKKKRKDPLELKLEEERGVRAALELAFYGPEVTYEIPVPKFEPIPQPIDVGDLPQVIASAQHNQYLSSVKQDADDEEDELAMILKDLG